MATLTLDQRSIPISDGQTVLEALEAAGVAVASACRSGVCQTCMVQASGGAIPEAAQAGLSAPRRRLGYLLACVCRLEGDLALRSVDAGAELQASIVSREAIADVLVLHLALTGPLDFQAGQFITLLREDGIGRPYSIASLPGEATLELHVRHLAGGAMSEWLAHAPIGAGLRVRGPFGECIYIDGEGEGERPLLLAGTGTGLAPILGILRAALARGHQGPITVIHGARSPEALYRLEFLRALAAAHDHVTVIASALTGEAAGVVAEPVEGLLAAQAQGLAERAQARAYLCGDPGFVQRARRQLFLAGLSMRRIHADAFLPAQPAP
jgi:CDP-4-dehydro-6-deoxyglucose reductase, E3